MNKNVKKLGLGIIAGLLAMSLIVGCSKKETNESVETSKKEKVTFVLDWLPNTNHTGIYTALEKGYFDEEGLEVEIIQPAETGANILVATNQAQFGVGFQEQITSVRSTDSPLPIKAVAAIIQHNTSGFASPVDKNIVTPADFEGKTYGSWGTDLENAFIKTLMDKSGADFSKLDSVILQSGDFFVNVKEFVDFQWIYYGWDGMAAEVKDYPINFIKLQDMDERLDFYTPVIMTNETIIKENPELIRKFLRAATKGYEFAIENPEEAVKDLLKHADGTDEAIALASQKYLSKEYLSDGEQWGKMKPEIWQTFGQWMQDNGLLENEFNYEEAFTNEFLPERN